MSWDLPQRLVVAIAAVFLAGAPALAVQRPGYEPPRGSLTSANGPASAISVECVDVRTGSTFAYSASHLTAGGTLDSAWTADGRLCLGAADGLHQVVCRDGAGGAYAGWVDARRGDDDIWLQHFTATGEVAPSWPVAGLPVCAARYSQYHLALAPDGSGGVFLAWQDFRAAGAGEIFVQRLSAAGDPAAGWPADGRAVCASASEQSGPRLASDGSGGVWVVWQDRRRGSLDLFVQRIEASGSTAPGWPPEGTALTHGDGDEVAPAVVSDSTGRLIILWRCDGPQPGVQAAGCAPSRVPGPGWPGEPLTLATGATSVSDPSVVALPGGGAMVAWAEQRTEGSGIRVQCLTSDASLAASWPAEGRALCSSNVNPVAVALLALPDSGAIAAWDDRRAETGDIYAQRVGAAGVIAEGWPENGIAVCTAAGDQYSPALAADGGNGALVTWSDAASEAQAGFFSARAAGGRVAELVEATARPGHARVLWRALADLGGEPSGERRLVEAGEWQGLGACVLADSARVVLEDRAAPEGATVEYRLVVRGENFVRYFPPVRLAIPVAPLRLALHRAWPIAAQDVIVLEFALPRGAAPSVDLYDIQGRRVERQVFEGLEPGELTLRFSVSQRMATGVYFVRLTQGPEARVKKLAFIR